MSHAGSTNFLDHTFWNLEKINPKSGFWNWILDFLFEQKLKNEIFYYENVDKFKLNLERYLEEGQFYKYKKDLSKSYLLNLDNFNRRDKVLNEVLDNFSKN